MRREERPSRLHAPRVDGAEDGVEQVDAEDVHEEREDGDHLEEEEETGDKRHDVRTEEVVEQILRRRNTNVQRRTQPHKVKAIIR